MSTRSFVSRYRLPILLAGLVVVIGLWWLFRPERLFVNQRVSEAAPSAIADAQPLFTGSLHGVNANNEVHGRVNVVKQSSGLALAVTGLEMKTGAATDVYLTGEATEGANAVAHAQKIVSLPAGAASAQGDIPTGVDPAVSRHALLVDDASKQIIATATLEAF